MKIEVRQVKKPDGRAYTALETVLKCTLPSSVIDFYEQYNGGVPDPNTFGVALYNECCVNGFIPLGCVPDELDKFKFRADFIPIAWAEGGNYIVVNVISENVYFLDHEIEDEYVKLSDNLQFFLQSLDPIDLKVSALTGQKVITAWIDPDFLKLINKK